MSVGLKDRKVQLARLRVLRASARELAGRVSHLEKLPLESRELHAKIDPGLLDDLLNDIARTRAGMILVSRGATVLKKLEKERAFGREKGPVFRKAQKELRARIRARYRA